MGIAFGILLLCVLEFEICLEVKYPQLLANVAKKLQPGQGCYNMPIFKLSAAKRMCILSRHILPEMHQFFTCSKSTFEKFTRNRNPGPLLTGVGMETEGEKGK